MKKGEQKDYFSSQANVYAAFRPTYPEAMYQFIFQHLKGRNAAWDCATGNGQVANYLADYFKKVYATDISQQQLAHAVQRTNIVYSLSSAEKTSFPEHQFDLITVGQALHWFEREAFYNEVKRVAAPGALLAVWGYAFLNIDPAIDKLILNFYHNIVGPYWDQARRLVEEEYNSVEFPFEQITTPRFFISAKWNVQHLAGYLESWSATQKYIKNRGVNPVPELTNEIGRIWPAEIIKDITFPVFLKLGEIA
ncbi:MAG: SAM-dependent methyltransferase [Marivirga sp.]|nr:SAM-dependent methyltransferase [Marivirga sp.]